MKILTYLAAILVLFYMNSCTNTKTKAESKNDSIAKTEEKLVTYDKAKNQFDAIAHFIAGIKVDSTTSFYKLTKTESWRRYNAEADSTWKKFYHKTAPFLKWAKDENIASLNDSVKTIFYPFSGPDILYASRLFPNANKYYLIGLENAGSVPAIDSLTTETVKADVNMYKKAINDVMVLSFFKTINMHTELSNKEVDGTLPIILMFLARSNKSILDIDYLNINDNGEFVSVGIVGNKKHCAVSVKFTDSTKQIKTLYYLSADISDSHLKVTPSLTKFLSKLDNKVVTYLKSASYLLHKSYFSVVRNTILDKSVALLQDDSGIGFKYFDKEKWNIQLYGKYDKPIAMFKVHFEQDLYDAYKASAKPINFRLGYNTTSNLLLAKKK